MGGVIHALAVLGGVVWCACILYMVVMVALARSAAERECPCADRVPVHVVTGQHVADLCTGCGRQITMAAWVNRGE